MNYIKFIKFTVIGILLSLCIAMNGELYQLYLTEFEGGCYKSSFSLPQDKTESDMLSDLQTQADKHNVLIFKVCHSALSVTSSEVRIHADEKTTIYIKKNFDIEEGRFKSLFSGTAEVKFLPFTETPVSLLSDEDYVLIGEEENMMNFARTVRSTYGNTLPKVSSSDKHKNMVSVSFTLWIMLIIFCCSLTLFESAYQKKESFIRTVLGENVTKYIFKNAATDNLYLIGLFVIFKLICKLYYHTSFLSEISWIALSLLITLNSITYLNMKPKGVLSLKSHEKQSKKLLTVNYVVKSICVILTTLMVSSNIAVINEGINYYRQKSFFEEHSDYYAYNNFKSTGNHSFTLELERDFYNKFVDDMNIFFLCKWADVNGHGITFANINTKEYLSNKIEEFSNLKFDKPEYIIIHKDKKLSEDELEEIKLQAYHENSEIIYYEDDADIVVRTLESGPDTTLERNPIIIFSNNYEDPTELYLCFVKTDKFKLQNFSEKKGFEYSQTNILEYYSQKMLNYKRLIYLNSVLLFLIYIIELLVTMTIVRLEYSINAVELAIKKIFGYKDTERFSGLYLIIGSLWTISLLVALAISFVFDFGEPLFIIPGAVIILILDILTVMFNTKKYNSQSIQKILKGGAL